MGGNTFLLHRAQLFEHTSILDALDDESEMVNEARGIVDVLESFPLALDQAGAYIEETNCKLADYLQIYQDHRKRPPRQTRLSGNQLSRLGGNDLVSFISKS